MKLLQTAALIFFFAGAASASSLTNGDFETGDLTGFTENKSGLSDTEYSQFVSVQSDGTNQFLQISSGPTLSLAATPGISFSISVTDATSYLTFDTKFISATDANGDDLGRPAVVGLSDNVSAWLEDANGKFYRVFGHFPDRSEISSSTSSGATEFTTLISPTDSGFDTGVAVDLSRFLNQTVTLDFYSSAFSDAQYVTATFDNIHVGRLPGDSTPPAVPLPASLPLLLAALGGTAWVSRRRRTQQ